MSDQARIINATFKISLPTWDGRKVEPLPQFCFAGRSNVGKSSLINAIVERNGLARTSSAPGRTQAVIAFEAAARLGTVEHRFHLIDLPGYGYAKVPIAVKKTWRQMMASYFEGNQQLLCCVALLDIRRVPSAEDIDLLEFLRGMEVPILPLITKADKVGKTKRPAQLKQIAAAIGVDDWRGLHPVSVSEKLGIQEVRDEMFSMLHDLQDALAEAREGAPEPE